MGNETERFHPEQVDEQVEMLSHESMLNAPESSDARLITHLYKIYDEEREIADRVWARLSEQGAQEQPGSVAQRENASALVPTSLEKGPQPMQKRRNIHASERKPRRLLRLAELCAAVLIISALVGGMILVLQASRSSLAGKGKGKGTPTPIATVVAKTATPVVRDPNGLYIATTDGIERIDPQTNKVVWHINDSLARYIHQVTQGIVLFSGGDTIGPNGSNFYVAAADASTGRILWKKALGMTYDNLEIANGVVYASTCVMSCAIYALKASTGAQVWTYTALQGTSTTQTLQNGVLYEVSGSDYFALDAKTGKQLWRKTLPSYLEGNLAAPVVSNGVLSFSACDSFKQTSDNYLCTVVAYNATNGNKLWNTPLISFQRAVLGSPIVMDGIVYTGSSGGVVSAYNAQTGRFLWSLPVAGSVFDELQAAQGILYVPVATGDSISLCEITVATRAKTCQNIDAWPGKPGNAPLGAGNGIVSIVDKTNHIHVFSTTNGQEVATYSIQGVAAIRSFVLVSGQ